MKKDEEEEEEVEEKKGAQGNENGGSARERDRLLQMGDRIEAMMKRVKVR